MTLVLSWLAILATLSIYLAFVSRFHGGGFPAIKAPRVVKNMAWGLPFGIVTGLVWYDARYPAVNWVWKITDLIPYLDKFAFETIMVAICSVIGFIAFALAVAGKSLGHGQWQNLGTVLKRITPEKLDFIVSWFFGPDPRSIISFKCVITGKMLEGSRPIIHDKLYWRCVFGMALVGLAATLGAALIVGWISPPAGAIIALGGLLKGRAYVVGWSGFEFQFDDIDEPTEMGEAFTGLFAGYFLAIGYGAAILWHLAIH